MPTLQKRGRAWHLRWSENGQGRRVSLGPCSAKEAEQHRKAKERELARARLAGVIALPDAGEVPTLESFAEDYLAWHAAEFPSSHERIAGIVRQYLIPAFGSRPLDYITKDTVERYKGGRTAKAETVAKELRTLQAMLNRAVFLELIARNPAKGVKPPRNLDSKPHRWYTADELALIYQNSKPLAGDEAAKGKPVNSPVKDYAPVWRLLANTGLRRSEAQQLKWADVTDEYLRVLSTESARTKSGRWRQVPLSPGASAALKALRTATGATPYVLHRTQSRSLTRAFAKAVDRAGLDGSLHCLRHTYCAHLVMRGVPLRTVQILAGHAHFSTTEKYAHLAPDYLRASVAGLEL